MANRDGHDKACEVVGTVPMKKEKESLTLRQIAKLAKTSKSTVSRVLTKHPSVSSKTRERVQAVIEKHGFTPNLFARGLAGGRTGLIAVLTSEINSGFYAEVIKGVDGVASQHEGHLLSSFAHGTEDYIELWKGFARGGRVDGIILIAPPMEIFSQEVLSTDIPTVLCACGIDRSKYKWDDIDTVTVNNEAGINEILRHLVDQGCKKYLHISGPHNIYDGIDRCLSFERFIEDHPNLNGEVLETAMTRESGRSAALDYLKNNTERPEAIVACNDLVALGVLEALKESEIRVPNDIAVTGCDDDASSAILGLTTLHMPMLDLGRETARLLFDRLEARGDVIPARDSLIEMTLRVRGTSLAGRNR